ncbi:MAG: LacI family DNA-binding transcriptional regulator [Arachnia sp.]
MNGFPPRPTLADVAVAAGVSPVTVSRVVEGSAKVAAATRERVISAMESIGYYGNASASHLVSGRGGAIGIVTSNTAEYGYAATIQGVEQRARAMDLPVLISVIEGIDAASVQKSVRAVASHAVAGVIVIDFDESGHAVLPALPAYLPVVFATSPSDGRGSARPYIYMDDYEGGRLVAQHLIGLGHTAIFILAPQETQPLERRSQGIFDGLTEARLPHYPVIRCADWGPTSGYEGVQWLLDDYDQKVTAIACANDQVAIGAIRAIIDRGLRVPEDISVVGFDDHPLAAYASPPLTTVHQDFQTQGRLSFDLLDSLISGAPGPADRRVSPALIARDSTAAPNPVRGLSGP